MATAQTSTGAREVDAARAEIDRVTPGRRRGTWLSCGGGLAVAALALVLSLLSLAAPAPSPSVPSAGAQDTYHPELTITGFDTVPGFEAAYAGVDLTVTYRRRHTSVTECGTHTETYRINASGVPQRHGDAATLFQSLDSADRGLVSCTYILEWPDVTGFGKPESATLSNTFDRVQSGAYVAPTFYASSAGLIVEQTQALVDDVQARFGDTPNNVIRYLLKVNPTATSPDGCDADTKRLTVTELS